MRRGDLTGKDGEPEPRQLRGSILQKVEDEIVVGGYRLENI
jgi:hypothetical protein